VNADDALSRTNIKFKKRFQLMEELISKENLKIEELSLVQMDIYWEQAKQIIKGDFTV
jgi:uncharacterized protein YabN with tetrapyrrole methylase and pyrophosphatase domain